MFQVDSDPLFTVLLPIHRPPDLLEFSIRSVLAQEVGSFELFVICDGAPQETADAASVAMRLDSRIKVFVFEKGERLGEAHRHVALQQARGTFVCQIADDDLWLPEHLSHMKLLLDEVDFGNVLFTHVDVDGSPNIIDGDLGDPATRATMSTSMANLFGPSASGYRLATYRSLAEGWAPAPPGIWTDLHMWRKFLAHPGIRCGTRRAITIVHFSAAARHGWSLSERRSENARWFASLQDPSAREAFRRRLLPSTAI